jgi:flagellar FliJ protein
MKRFIFSLRPVAMLRSHRELRAREEFAVAIHALAKAQAHLEQVRTRVGECGHAIAAGREGTFHPGEELQSLAAYRQECAREVQGEQALAAAATEKEKRRAGYLVAHRDLEGIKRLEQQARRRHRQALDRAEQAEYDDFSNRSHHARRAALP